MKIGYFWSFEGEKVMSIQKKLENAAFEVYRKVTNQFCKGCPYTECQFRNKRAVLKRQRINHRKLRCYKECDELFNKSLNKK